MDGSWERLKLQAASASSNRAPKPSDSSVQSATTAPLPCEPAPLGEAIGTDYPRISGSAQPNATFRRAVGTIRLLAGLPRSCAPPDASPPIKQCLATGGPKTMTKITISILSSVLLST